jgi:hypothetical protein
LSFIGKLKKGIIIVMGVKKEFNEYKILGDITAIYLASRLNRDIVATIDTIDLKRLIDLDVSWYAGYDPNTKGYYVFHSEYLGFDGNQGKYKSHLLHRFLLNADDLDYVNHIDHNALNNTRKNLEIITNQQNLTNRKSRNSNNKSGYRNVCQVGNRWYVQLQVNGKSTVLKTFALEKLDEAGAYAEAMRKQYYGDYAGNN